jgi:hypothetical protein
LAAECGVAAMVHGIEVNAGAQPGAGAADAGAATPANRPAKRPAHAMTSAARNLDFTDSPK